MTRKETRVFEPHSGEIAVARHWTSAVLGDWGLDEVDPILVVSELATNAVVHGRSQFTVTICLETEDLTVEVGDLNPRLPVAGEVHADSLGGRGLPLIGAVTTDWGVRPARIGKSVWARFAVAPATG